ADEADADADEEEEEEEEEETESTGPEGPDPELARQLFGELKTLHDKHLKALKKHGAAHKTTQKLQDEITAIFMQLKMPPRMVDLMVGNLRMHIERIREQERAIMSL